MLISRRPDDGRKYACRHPDIFISYSRTDTALVDRLERDLNQAGYTTWVDRHQLPGSQNWYRELQDAIERARSMLVVLSPAAVDSTNVQAEYAFALDEHKPIIPLLYRSCKIPMELRRLQQVDFTVNYGSAFAELLKALLALNIRPSSPPPVLAPLPVTPARPTPSPPVIANHAATPPTISRRSLTAGTALSVLVVAALIMIIIIHSRNPNTGNQSTLRSTTPTPKPTAIHYPTGTIVEFPLSAGSSPAGIIGGPDGNLWFTENNGNRIGRMTPSGTLTEFLIKTANSGPFGITNGRDGNFWFTEILSKQIGRMTLSGTVTEFPITTANSTAYNDITTGIDGNVWFTEAELGGDLIGRMTPSGTFTEFPLSGGSIPAGITDGPDGNLWFTETGRSQIGRISP